MIVVVQQINLQSWLPLCLQGSQCGGPFSSSLDAAINVVEVDSHGLEILFLWAQYQKVITN